MTSMFCAECGARLSDGAKFCAACGTLQQTSEVRATADQWETATIRYLPRGVLDEGEKLQGLSVSPARVIVRVAGPESSYVAHSERIRNYPVARAKTEALAGQAKSRLTTALLAQGWKPEPTATNDLVFRRPFAVGRVPTFRLSS